MAYLDILFLAVVAVAVALRLRSVLGQRNDNDPQRPNPLTPPPRTAAEDEDDSGPVMRPRPAPLSEDAAPGSPLLAPPPLAPDSLAGTLAQIARHDPGFDEKSFLSGARAAFDIIVRSFAAGDTAALQPLLAPEVYGAFARAIQSRPADAVPTELIALKDAEIIRASLKGDVAQLTIRFLSEQKSATREEVEDVWTFARSLRSRDPNWQLVETRG